MKYGIEEYLREKKFIQLHATLECLSIECVETEVEKDNSSDDEFVSLEFMNSAFLKGETTGAWKINRATLFSEIQSKAW